MPGRAEGADGDGAAGRRRERVQAGEGGHPRADRAPPAQAAPPAEALREPRHRRGPLPRRLHALRQRGVQVPGGHPRRRRGPRHQAHDPPGAPPQRDGQGQPARHPGLVAVHAARQPHPRGGRLPHAADAGVVDVVAPRCDAVARGLLRDGAAEGGAEGGGGGLASVVIPGRRRRSSKTLLNRRA